MPKAYRGGTAILAAHFAKNHQELAGKTLAELADFYDVTAARMRTVLRAADPMLASKGLVLCIPTRMTGFVVIVTAEEKDFLYGVISRLVPITSEITRYDRQHATVTGASSFGVLVQGLNLLIEDLAERVLAE